MSRFRFSVRNLLLAILAFALALAVLQWDSEIIASAAFTAFLGALALGVTGALCRRGAARAFWIGFAVFGWFYAEAAFPTNGGASTYGVQLLGLTSRIVSSSSRESVAPVLLTDLLFDFASANAQLRVGSKVMAQWQSGSYYLATIDQINGGQYLAVWQDGSAPSWVRRNQIQLSNLAGRQAAHSVMAIFLAIVGGALAEALFSLNSGLPQNDRDGDPPRQPTGDRVDGPQRV